MAIRTPAVLKTYFETGKFPTQEQFADLIDSLRHMQAAIPIGDVSGLVTTLNTFIAVSQLGQLLEGFKIRQPITGSIENSDLVSFPANMLVRELLLSSASNCSVTIRQKNMSSTDQEVVIQAGSTVVVVIQSYFLEDQFLSFIDPTATINYQINTY